MEGARFLLAVVLMIAVVIVTNLIFPPVPPDPAGFAADSVSSPLPPPPVAGVPDSPAIAVDTSPGPADTAVVAAQPQDSAVVAQVAAAPDTVRVTSPLYRFGVSTRGGALVQADLLQYESLTSPGEPVWLASRDAPGLVRHRVRIGDDVLDLRDLTFDVEPAAGLNLAEGGARDSLRMTHSDPARGLDLDFVYRFDPDRYVIDVRGRVTHRGGTTPQLLIDFGPGLPFHEWNEREEIASLAYVVNQQQQGIESVRLDRVTGEQIQNGPLLWAALKNKYFVVAAIQAQLAPRPFGGLIARPAGSERSVDLTATLLPNDAGEFAYRVYVGPQQYDRLAEIGHQFADVNPYGWRFLRPIIRPLAHAITWLLLGMHSVLSLSYGWVLILFGVMIRVVLWPLNAKAMRSQMKSMELQPRLKEIQTKYKSNPEQLQKEMLRIYREEGFNPMGGCLPLLIPFPVLITLFFVFQATIEFRGVPFLWLPDLSRPDPFYIIPVLMGLSMFVLQWLSLRSTPVPNPQMKMMMWFMPIFMVVLFANFASGLNLYYTAMNVASLPQQWMIARERQRWHAAKGTGHKEAAPQRS
jgi:YidC/Oxa1 family membrane protein insertase